MWLHLVPGEGGQEVGLVTLGEGTSKQEEKSSNVEPETDASHLLLFSPDSWLKDISVTFCRFLTNDFATLPQPWQRCKGIDWGTLLLNVHRRWRWIFFDAMMRRRMLNMMTTTKVPEEVLCSRGRGDTTPLLPGFYFIFIAIYSAPYDANR